MQNHNVTGLDTLGHWPFQEEKNAAIAKADAAKKAAEDEASAEAAMGTASCQPPAVAVFK